MDFLFLRHAGAVLRPVELPLTRDGPLWEFMYIILALLHTLYCNVRNSKYVTTKLCRTRARTFHTALPARNNVMLYTRVACSLVYGH